MKHGNNTGWWLIISVSAMLAFAMPKLFIPLINSSEPDRIIYIERGLKSLQDNSLQLLKQASSNYSSRDKLSWQNLENIPIDGRSQLYIFNNDSLLYWSDRWCKCLKWDNHNVVTDSIISEQMSINYVVRLKNDNKVFYLLTNLSSHSNITSNRKTPEILKKGYFSKEIGANSIAFQLLNGDKTSLSYHYNENIAPNIWLIILNYFALLVTLSSSTILLRKFISDRFSWNLWAITLWTICQALLFSIIITLEKYQYPLNSIDLSISYDGQIFHFNTILYFTFSLLLISTGFYRFRQRKFTLSIPQKYVSATLIIIVIVLITYFEFTLIRQNTYLPYKGHLLNIEHIAYLSIIILLTNLIQILLIYLLITQVLYSQIKNNNVLFIFTIIIIVSLLTAIFLNITIKDNRLKKLQYVKAQLEKSVDPLLEYNFIQFKEQILQDNVLTEFIINQIENGNDNSDSLGYFTKIKNYFPNSRYQFTICGNNDYLHVDNEINTISCSEFFNQMIEESGETTGVDGLFIIKNNLEEYYYLGIIPLTIENETIGLYLEILTPYLTTDNNSLRQDNNSFDLREISFARYQNNIVLYKYGEKDFPVILDSDEYTKYKDLSLRTTCKSKTTDKIISLIVVMDPVSISDKVFPFSFFLILLSLFFILIYIPVFYLENIRRQTILLRTRIQLTLLVVAMMTILALGVVSIVINQQNNITLNKEQLNEKAYSVAIEIQDKLGNNINYNTNNESEITHLLQRFSAVFFTEINLYRPSGELANSSFEAKNTDSHFPKLINPKSFQAIMINNQLNFTTQEHLNGREYFSSYIPIVKEGGVVSGIINLPLYDRQIIIEDNLLTLLINIINMIVLIGILVTILSILLARYMTRPLSLLQNHLSLVSVNKRNQPISWKNQDEIGKLIDQYNTMVEKLEESAEILKQSERENTWREMARQIAHEIKNPLTPMKLNVQYLLKAYKEEDSDFENKLNNGVNSLIEQIETLNSVADMFSDISKTGKKSKSPINLNPLIKQTVSFFDNQHNINFKLDFSNNECVSIGTEGDLVRVLNNLIQNAIQAIKHNQGIIIIKTRCDKNTCTITIKDNGEGIDSESQKRIFMPYFTTKTRGTGLGLAISKSIIDDHGGNIFFTTDPQKGTIFVIELPRYQVS